MTIPKGLPHPDSWPPWLQRAAADVGVRELPGVAVHPRIATYYDHTRLGDSPNDDEVAWCSAAMCCWMEEAGYKSTRSARARSWLGWGDELTEPRFGCVVVFSRGNPSSGQGHVALYVQPAPPAHVLVIGGNQHNSVRFSTDYETARILGFRWPRESDRLDTITV